MPKKSTTKTEQYHFKIVLLGEIETGKTAIKRQLCEEQYTAIYKSTLGVEEGVYQGDIEQGKFRVIFYDTSGQERFKSMCTAHIASSQAAFFVYDLKNPASLENLEPRIKEISENNSNILKVLVGNKNDLCDTTTADNAIKEKAVEIAQRYKMKKYECSAKIRPSLVKVVHETVKDLVSNQLLKGDGTYDPHEMNKNFKGKHSKPEDSAKIAAKRIAGDSVQPENESPSKKEDLDPSAIQIDASEKKDGEKEPTLKVMEVEDKSKKENEPEDKNKKESEPENSAPQDENGKENPDKKEPKKKACCTIF